MKFKMHELEDSYRGGHGAPIQLIASIIENPSHPICLQEEDGRRQYWDKSGYVVIASAQNDGPYIPIVTDFRNPKEYAEIFEN